MSKLSSTNAKSNTLFSLPEAAEQLIERNKDILQFLYKGPKVKDIKELQKEMIQTELALLELRSNLSKSKDASLIAQCDQLIVWAGQLDNTLRRSASGKEFDLFKTCSYVFILPFAAKNLYAIYFPYDSTGAKIVPAVVALGGLGIHHRSQIATVWKMAKSFVTRRIKHAVMFTRAKAAKAKAGFCEGAAVVKRNAAKLPKAARKIMAKLRGAAPS